MTNIETPASLGGAPVTMATNNWWDGLTAVVKETGAVVNQAAQNYVQVRQAKQLVQAQFVADQNRPPGTLGLNPQAAGIAGGQAQGVGAFAGVSPLVLVALGLVAVVVLAKVVK